MHLAPTERRQRLCAELRACSRALLPQGPPGDSGPGEPGRLNRSAWTGTFGGGVSEVRRESVATMRPGTTRGLR
ncbi:hypothetical protein [Streptomyces sp. NPDC001348]